ncbi:hypothetical protein AEB_P2629 [Altererythrobacter sp. B11]|nr:hypothetical protein AEB_P2629 [Altererythrobacter sp. B11]
MQMGVEEGSFRGGVDQRKGGPDLRAALLYLMTQADAGIMRRSPPFARSRKWLRNGNRVSPPRNTISVSFPRRKDWVHHCHGDDRNAGRLARARQQHPRRLAW